VISVITPLFNFYFTRKYINFYNFISPHTFIRLVTDITILVSSKGLTEEEKAILVIAAYSCSFSLGAHVSDIVICSKRPTHLRGGVKKVIKSLVKKGYLQKHPTGGSMTWQLTRVGLDTAVSLEEGH
jgi:hypothetical protein